MNLSSRIIAAVVLAFALAGCATDARPYEGADRGFLIASIGAQLNMNFPEYMFRYRSRDRQVEGSIRLPSTFVSVGSADFKSPAKWGVVTLARLAPGQYEIYNYKIDLNRLGFVAGQDFSIPFTIKAGEATYVGEYLANTGIEEGLFGQTHPTLPFSFLIANEQRRDLELAKAKSPDLANVTVSNAVPDVKTLGPRFLSVDKN